MSKPKKQNLFHLNKETVQEASKLCTFQPKSFEIRLDRLNLKKMSSASQTDEKKTNAGSSKRSNDILINHTAKKTNSPGVNKIQLNSGEGSSMSSPRRSTRIKSLKEKKPPAVVKKEKDVHGSNELNDNARNPIISQIQMTNLLWRELLSHDFKVAVGQVVCAKMSTYWPWPAIVTGFNRNRALVKFFGDMKQGSVPKLQCVPFLHCHKIIFHYVNSIDDKVKQRWQEKKVESLELPRESSIREMSLKELYIQAIRDVEIYLNTPSSLIEIFL